MTAGGGGSQKRMGSRLDKGNRAVTPVSGMGGGDGEEEVGVAGRAEEE